MKKLLTLALALVLAFALAAPALAITGDTSPEETSAKVAPVQLSVELFTAPDATLSGELYLTNIAADKMYIVNEIAYWGVALKFFEENDDQALNMAPEDYLGSELTISCDAFKLKEVAAAHTWFKEGSGKVQKWGGTLTTLNEGKLTAELDAMNCWDTDTSVFLFGQGVVTSKGLLTAKVQLPSEWPLEIFNGTKLKYFVAVDDEEAPTLFAVSNKADGSGNKLYFEVEDGEVTGIFVTMADNSFTYAEIEFKKIISGGGSVVASIGDEEEGDAFDAALKFYNGVMSFFGFNYDAEGKLYMRHFESKDSNLFLKDQATINLYTGSIVLPNGPEVPKTGDAASIMGFVMIALALVAAGFVVSKKVRA